MGKKYKFEEVKPEEGMVREPTLESSLQAEAEINLFPSLTEDELNLKEQMCEQARRAVEDVKAGRLTNHEELKKRFT